MEYPPFIDDVSISTSIDMWYDMIYMIYALWYMIHDTWYWYCMVWYCMDVWMYVCMYIIVYIIILIGYFPASHVWVFQGYPDVSSSTSPASSIMTRACCHCWPGRNQWKMGRAFSCFDHNKYGNNFLTPALCCNCCSWANLNWNQVEVRQRSIFQFDICINIKYLARK